MGNKIKVSIIIPTYNRKHFLREAIDSSLNQSYENIEIIVSDNHSIDGTDDMMLSEYKGIDKIKYFRNEKNIGPIPNWNLALKERANGDYAIVLSDDDYFIDNNYIKEAVKVIEKTGAKFIFSNWKQRNEYENGTITYEDKICEISSINNGLEFFDYIDKIRLCFASSIIDKNIAINKFDGYNEKNLSSDKEMAYKFFAENYKVSFLPIKSVVYRKHVKSISGNYNNYIDLIESFSGYLFAYERLNKSDTKNRLYKLMNDRLSNYLIFRIKLFEYKKFYFEAKGKNSLLSNILLSIFTNPFTLSKIIILKIIRLFKNVLYKSKK